MVAPYSNRLVDVELDALLPSLPALAIEGPKGVGKTATALRRVQTAYRLDDEATRRVIEAAPHLVTERAAPTLIDEWQRCPTVWDVVRRAVDDGAAPGSFLLTGSAAPSPDVPLHSGAGRIASVRMRPMGLSERGVHATTVSLVDLLAGRSELSGESALTVVDYAREITASGLPGIRALDNRGRRAQLDGYLLRATSRELHDQGVVVRRPHSLRAWLTAYAAAESTTAGYEEIRRAATPGDADPPSKVTSLRYRDWLTGLWLLDPVEPWMPAGVTLSGLGASPKHHLADPALTARLLDVEADDLLDAQGDRIASGAGPLLGALFESLATLTVRSMAQACEARVSHLRTRRGDHEVDLIVEGRRRRVLALEVKLAARIDDLDVRHLHWLRDHLGDRLIDAVVLSTGPVAYRRADGIGVVPLALLGL